MPGQAAPMPLPPVLAKVIAVTAAGVTIQRQGATTPDPQAYPMSTHVAQSVAVGDTVVLSPTATGAAATAKIDNGTGAVVIGTPLTKSVAIGGGAVTVAIEGGAVTVGGTGAVTVGTAASASVRLGAAITQPLGLYGATPVAQRSGAAQAAAATTSATNTSPYGFTTAAQANALVTLVNELRAALVALGAIKGSA